MADFATALRTRLISFGPLSTLLATRVYPLIRPQSSPLPAIRYQVISDPRPENLKGYDGARVSRVQVDCFASTYVGARDVAEKVVAAIASPATVAGVQFGRVKAEGPRDLFNDTDSGDIYGASVDLLVEHRLV
jgi:hypothetical protein